MRPMTGICEVVITGPDAAWLAGFTRELVEAGLAACGQNIERVRSIYRWEGEVQDEIEARVALHTRPGLVQQIIEYAQAHHPYDTPCVLALPVLAANPAYEKWVWENTSGQAGQTAARRS